MSFIDLYIRDKQGGEIHRIGEDIHDELWVDDTGTVHYHNLQNGDGCGAYSHTDQEAGYEFLPSEPGEPGRFGEFLMTELED